MAHLPTVAKYWETYKALALNLIILLQSTNIWDFYFFALTVGKTILLCATQVRQAAREMAERAWKER